jgi:glycosyltransferase involved in cell wall biosynthesis
MVPVEAMACGVPVLAQRAGGALETIIEGATGEFFDAATPEVVVDGVRRLLENEKKYIRQNIIARAQEFSKERFQKELLDFIAQIK